MFLMLIGQKLREKSFGLECEDNLLQSGVSRMMRVCYRKRLVEGESCAVLSKVDRILANEALGQCLERTGWAGIRDIFCQERKRTVRKSSPFRF